jgi:hypothetical protein
MHYGLDVGFCSHNDSSARTVPNHSVRHPTKEKSCWTLYAGIVAQSTELAVMSLRGWLLKMGVIRYGGMQIHRLARPFFIGLILGDYVSGRLWAIPGCVTGIQTYKVMPI